MIMKTTLPTILALAGLVALAAPASAMPPQDRDTDSPTYFPTVDNVDFGSNFIAYNVAQTWNADKHAYYSKGNVVEFSVWEEGDIVLPQVLCEDTCYEELIRDDCPTDPKKYPPCKGNEKEGTICEGFDDLVNGCRFNNVSKGQICGKGINNGPRGYFLKKVNCHATPTPGATIVEPDTKCKGVCYGVLPFSECPYDVGDLDRSSDLNRCFGDEAIGGRCNGNIFDFSDDGRDYEDACFGLGFVSNCENGRTALERVECPVPHSHHSDHSDHSAKSYKTGSYHSAKSSKTGSKSAKRG